MLTRRRFVGYSALASAMLASRPLLASGSGQEASGQHPLRLAILGSVYSLGSSLQDFADRFLVGYPWEGDWHKPPVEVVSLYVDQRARRTAAAPSGYQLAMSGTRLAPAGPGPNGGKPGSTHAAPQHEEEIEIAGDLSEARSHQFGFRLARNIPDALRRGGNRIAVDAVLCVVEQDDYASNDRGQVLLPTYDFFQQCAQVFEEEKHSVPFFSYGALSFSFPEAQSMVAASERVGFPLLAGSAFPFTWRLPDIDVPLEAPVEEAVIVGPGSLDSEAFDALEALQAMMERRRGGESGVKAVQLLEGDDVWAAAHAGRWSQELLSSALSRSDTPLGLTVLDGRTQDLVASGVLAQLVKDPVACCVEYSDGTRAVLLLLNGAIEDVNIALRIAGHDGPLSTQFFLPPAPNRDWSAALATQIEAFYTTRTAPWPVERTLLTTGLLEACFHSRHQLNQRLETPQLAIHYKPPRESQYACT